VKVFTTILFSCWTVIAWAQQPSGDKTVQPLNITAPVTPRKPEIFTSGFIDVVNTGQINAAARLVKIYIGEPGKFALPLSIFSGVSANSFQNYSATTKANEDLVANFINPTTGLGNICFEGSLFRKKDSIKLTRFGLLYALGERVLTGRKTGLITDPQTGQPVNFLNTYALAGLYFQTGAWNRNNTKDMGVCWLAFRYIGCMTNPGKIKEIIPVNKKTGIYHGYSAAWGIEINQSLNTKVIIYKYIKRPEVEYYLPIFQFSFNYTLPR